MFLLFLLVVFVVWCVWCLLFFYDVWCELGQCCCQQLVVCVCMYDVGWWLGMYNKLVMWRESCFFSLGDVSIWWDISPTTQKKTILGRDIQQSNIHGFVEPSLLQTKKIKQDLNKHFLINKHNQHMSNSTPPPMPESIEDKIQYCLSLKEEGNHLFRAQQYTQAIRKYKTVCSIYWSIFHSILHIVFFHICVFVTHTRHLCAWYFYPFQLFNENVWSKQTNKRQ